MYDADITLWQALDDEKTDKTEALCRFNGTSRLTVTTRFGTCVFPPTWQVPWGVKQ